jgi:hypothetical protein
VSAVLRAGAISLLAASLVACGGGGGGNADEDAIEEMVQQFFQAFEDGDAAALAVLFGQECGDMTAAAESAIEQYEDFGEIEIDLDGVSVQNLTESSAEFLPQGTVKSEDEETELSSPDEDYSVAVKENGVWKIAECDLFL